MLHTTNGAFGVILPYLVSCLGSAIGLQSMVRARSTVQGTRFWWLLLGALSIGGCGIWAMHFIAMLGFGVTGMTISYDIPITIASMVIAVAVVGVGLTISVKRDGRGSALLLGGAITGLGVSAMHYIGMAAMQVPASTTYNPALVALSVLIGVVAATAALWATMNIRGFFGTMGAALVMGLAVCSMHYTGMAALKVGTLDPMAAAHQSGGMTTSQLLAPLIIGIGASMLMMIFLVVLAPPEHELRSEAELKRNLEAIRAGNQQASQRV